MESYGFQPVVRNNTRRDACLDNIFLNFEIDSATIEARDFNISDPDGQLINIPVARTSKSTPNTESTFRPVTGEGRLAFYNIVERTYCNKERPYITHWFSGELRKMRDHLSFLGDVCKRCGSPNLGNSKFSKINKQLQRQKNKQMIKKLCLQKTRSGPCGEL
ncbi:hypothetical protein HHI36_003011 [Cryptolaemus montrouzieri]|uniref:Uncharacterized protein n=1 Tax=Cryptolaemus montrouzieri TaxID=559131 RepID=A0ABD2PCP7_9CUCU